MQEETIVHSEKNGKKGSNSPKGEKRPNKQSHARNRVTALVGAIILIFAAVGFVTTIVLASSWVASKMDNQEQKNQFADFIYPLVMLDPPTFDSVGKLGSSTILSAGAWNFIMNADKSKYEKDEFGFMTVPQSDLEVYATQLFGEGLVFEHQSLGDSEFSFTYNLEDGVYYISDSSLFFSYTPRVTQIEYKANKIHLRVEYIAPSFRWSSSHEGGNQEKIAKIMEYVLEDNQNGSYKIVSSSTILSGVTDNSSSASSSNTAASGSSSTAQQ